MARPSSVLFVIYAIVSTCRSSDRDGRWFNAGTTVTKLFVDNLIVTSVVPSSCVDVATTLPPCRGLRFLNIERIFPTTTSTVQSDVVAETASSLPDPDVDSRRRRPKPSQHDIVEHTPYLPADRPPGTWNPVGYFDFVRGATVTKTATRLLTQTVLDPARTVTFAIKVCRPSRMPFDLPPCDQDDDVGVGVDATTTIPVVETTSIPELGSVTTFSAIEPSESTII